MAFRRARRQSGYGWDFELMAATSLSPRQGEWKMARILKRFIADEKGLETVEYAVIAALITLAAIATITTVGVLVNDKFTELADKLGPAAPAP